MKTHHQQTHGVRLDGMTPRHKRWPLITVGMTAACVVLFFITPEAICDRLVYRPYMDSGLTHLMLTTVTGVFLHASFSQLVANMLCLLVLGGLLERRLGAWYCITAMMLGSVLANLVGLNLMLARMDLMNGVHQIQKLSWPPAGASGAVAGLLGLWVVFGGGYSWSRWLRPGLRGYALLLRIGAAVMIGLWGTALLSGRTGMMDGQGYWAGFLGGLMLALVFRLQDDDTDAAPVRLEAINPPGTLESRPHPKGSVTKSFRTGCVA